MREVGRTEWGRWLSEGKRGVKEGGATWRRNECGGRGLSGEVEGVD